MFGGDFRQILPVKIKGTRETTVGACLLRSPLWSNITVLHLTKNMHLAKNPEDVEYATWLLKVGNGQLTAEDGSILLSNDKKCGDTVDSLIQAVYPGISQLSVADNLHDQWFSDCTILSALNDDVDAINDRILDKFSGELKVFQSVDKAIIEEGADQIEAHYSTEYLNSINASVIHLSELKVKIGCPIMILCNLDPANGLCNGAQAILTRFSTHVLEVQLIGGQHAGKLTFIP